MNSSGVRYSRMQVCRKGHVTAPYAFVNIPDEDAMGLMVGLRCPHPGTGPGFGLCDLPTARLLDHPELLSTYMLGGDEAVTPLLRAHRKRYGL